MEFIIKNLSDKEEKILEDNNIDFCIDDLFSNNRDINIVCSETKFKEILSLLGRKNSFN